jgi:hypothetical protein
MLNSFSFRRNRLIGNTVIFETVFILGEKPILEVAKEQRNIIDIAFV